MAKHDMNITNPEDISIHSLEVNEMIGGIPAGILRKEVLVILVTIVVLVCISGFVELPAMVRVKLRFYPNPVPVAVTAGVGGVVHYISPKANQSVEQGEYLVVYKSAGDTKSILALDQLLRTKGIDRILPQDLAGFQELGTMQRPFNIFKCLVETKFRTENKTSPKRASQSGEVFVEAYFSLLNSVAGWKKQFVVVAPAAGKLLLDPHMYVDKSIKPGTVSIRIAPPIQGITCSGVIQKQPGLIEHLKAEQFVIVRIRGLAPGRVVQAKGKVMRIRQAYRKDSFVLELSIDRSFVRLFNENLVQAHEDIESEIVVEGNSLLTKLVSKI